MSPLPPKPPLTSPNPNLSGRKPPKPPIIVNGPYPDRCVKGFPSNLKTVEVKEAKKDSNLRKLNEYLNEFEKVDQKTKNDYKEKVAKLEVGDVEYLLMAQEMEPSLRSEELFSRGSRDCYYAVRKNGNDFHIIVIDNAPFFPSQEDGKGWILKSEQIVFLINKIYDKIKNSKVKNELKKFLIDGLN